ncbi:MAG: copper amine oxidase N-terminal domain-containing protein [Defluviitaleaceae bacterium]|nr:copper amine oxidase N-terminal domain-containing protein [Defluviitaleaceae bacterium]
MKKFLASLLMLGIMFLVLRVYLVYGNDRVEISFRVGDTTLHINGSPVEVEPPFIIDGVTLVPVRVITEAFGADVSWVAETREVILSYQDVEISLQIDNTSAVVNGQRQTLPLAPQIANGSTMVPLRFISANFGADVGWDGATQAVTVTKESFGTGSVAIEDALRRSSMPMVGDSHLGWSIRQTPGFEVEFRSFDGRLNTFTLSHDAYYEVDYFDNADDESLEAIRALELETARQFTLIRHSMGKTNSGVEYILIQLRDRLDFIERRIFLLPTKEILVVMTTISDTVPANERDGYLAIIDTFDLVFDAATTEDLSDIVDGMRLVESEDFNVQFRVPMDWRKWNNRSESINFMEFGTKITERVYAGVSLEIFSKQGEDSAEQWADEVLQDKITSHNSRVYKFSAIMPTKIGGVDAVYFTEAGRYGDADLISTQVFWELGGYMYNIYVTAEKGDDETIKRILDTVSFERINPSAVGVLFREPVGGLPVFSTVTNSAMGISVDVPATWSRTHRQTSSMFEGDSGILLTISEQSRTVNIIRSDVEEALRRALREDGTTSVRGVTAIPQNELSSRGVSGFLFEVRAEVDGAAHVLIHYVLNIDKASYAVNVIVPEHINSTASIDIIKRIIRSLATV